MPRVTTAFKEDRRAEILDAARRCVARSGFHQASMQDICAEAGMSPGNLYRYFPSKEAIIAGIAERDRAEVGAQLAAAQYTDDFFATFAALARHHLVDRSADDVGLCAEMVAESRRNPAIGRIMQDFDADVHIRLVAMLRAAAGRGDIRADVDFEGVVTMLMVIADGVWWRRAVDPAFDPETVLPVFMDLTRHMLLGNATDDNKNKDARS
jgi:TetR/AcrR family transcriptional regulator, repressor for uid operon